MYLLSLLLLSFLRNGLLLLKNDDKYEEKKIKNWRKKDWKKWLKKWWKIDLKYTKMKKKMMMRKMIIKKWWSLESEISH